MCWVDADGKEHLCWEMPELTEEQEKALEDHIERLLSEQSKSD